MNILMLGHQYRNYGTYWRIWFLARGLVKLGHEVTLATVSPRSRWKPVVTREDGVTLWEGPDFLHDLPGQGTGPLDILGRRKLVRQNPYDVIHGFEFHPNVRMPMHLGLRRKKTLVVSDWCDWYSEAGLGPTWGRMPGVKPLIGFQEDRLRRKVHGVTVISRLLEERSRKLVREPGEVLYLPGGAPVDVIRPEDKADSRKKWGIGAAKKVVGFVGTNQEDLDILAQAFIHCAQKDRDAMLLIIGPENQRASEMFRQQGLRDRVRVTGKFQYEDLASLMGCCDVFALPMRDTQGNAARWPNKIGEYLSAGRPVVASHAGEMKKFFETHPVGTAAENDASEFSGALESYLNDGAFAEQTGKQARLVAETVLAWDALSVQLEGFYRKMAAAHFGE